MSATTYPCSRCSDMADPTALTWEAATTKKESAT